MPTAVLVSIQCPACADAGHAGVMMRFIVFEDLWMNVSVAEADTTYRGSPVIRTQRRKVRTAIWRCPHGHRHQLVPEETSTTRR